MIDIDVVSLDLMKYNLVYMYYKIIDILMLLHL